jgi:hypothetical protein
MNINEESLYNVNLKRERNWNNNNLKHHSKRFKKNTKKSVTFKNKNNARNLNMTPNAIFSRKSVGVSKNRENLPDFITNKNVARKRYTNVNAHRKKTLKNLKNKKSLFKNNA